MKRVVLKFGAIAGVMLSVMMVATVPFLENVGDNGALIGYTTMVLSFLMVFFGIRSYRDNENEGVVSFGRAFNIGIMIALIGSLFYVATWEVISARFMPDFADKYSARVIEKQRASGASDAVIAQTQAEMQKFQKMYRNPGFRIPMTFLEVFPVGLLATLVSAAILRKRRSPELAPA